MDYFWTAELILVIAAIYMFIDWGCEGYYYIKALFAKQTLEKYGIGSWALITGSTDGIGLAFAKALASNGFNRVLVSRSIEKLTKVENELKGYPIQVLKIPKDFSECPQNPFEFFNDIHAQTRDLDISILINNVGGLYSGFFHEASTFEVLNQNNLNLWPIVYLSKIFISRMIKRNKPSGIINVSSTSSLIPLAGETVYCAGKAFDHLFTININEEVRFLVKQQKLKEIDILSFQPSWVDTPMTKDVPKSFVFISPEESAKNALRVLGKANYSSCHWKHLLISIFDRNVPWFILQKNALAELNDKKKID